MGFLMNVGMKDGHVIYSMVDTDQVRVHLGVLGIIARWKYLCVPAAIWIFRWRPISGGV